MKASAHLKNILALTFGVTSVRTFQRDRQSRMKSNFKRRNYGCEGVPSSYSNRLRTAPPESPRWRNCTNVKGA